MTASLKADCEAKEAIAQKAGKSHRLMGLIPIGLPKVAGQSRSVHGNPEESR
jgi:hypothetical protein